MANTKFEYVKKFEVSSVCLLNCWTVIRVDGRCFHKFADDHEYQRPNDKRGLLLLNKCAEVVMSQFNDIVCSYGQSDEYRREFNSFHRRIDLISSLMASSFVFYWNSFFPNTQLKYPPSFDGRCICYPSMKNIRDYLSWRQADCHINNLYNTCFWMLVIQGGKERHEAEKILRDTLSKDKNEMLFSQFNINYNNIEQLYRKGTLLVRVNLLNFTYLEKFTNLNNGNINIGKILSIFDDIIKDDFWIENPNVLY